MKLTNNIGMIVLAIYLLLSGVMGIMGGLNIPTIIPGVLALASGILLLIGK